MHNISPTNESRGRKRHIPPVHDVDLAITKVEGIIKSNDNSLVEVTQETRRLKSRAAKLSSSTSAETLTVGPFTAIPTPPPHPLIASVSKTKNLHFTETTEAGLFTLDLFTNEPDFLPNLNQYCVNNEYQTGYTAQFLFTLESLLTPLHKPIVPQSHLIREITPEWNLKSSSVLSLDLSMRFTQDDFPVNIEICAYRYVKSRTQRTYLVPDVILTTLAIQLINEEYGMGPYSLLKQLFQAYVEFENLALSIKIGNKEINYENLNIHTFLMLLAQGRPRMRYLQASDENVLQPCVVHLPSGEKKTFIPFTKFLYRMDDTFFQDDGFINRFRLFLASGLAKECLEVCPIGNPALATLVCKSFVETIHKLVANGCPFSGTLFAREYPPLKKKCMEFAKTTLIKNRFIILPGDDLDTTYKTTLLRCAALENTKKPRLGSFGLTQGWLTQPDQTISPAHLDTILAIEKNFFAFCKAPSEDLYNPLISLLANLEEAYPEASRSIRFKDFARLITAIVVPPAISTETSPTTICVPIFFEHPFMQVYFNFSFSPAKDLYHKYFSTLLDYFPLEKKHPWMKQNSLSDIQQISFPWLGFSIDEHAIVEQGNLSLLAAVEFTSRPPHTESDENFGLSEHTELPFESIELPQKEKNIFNLDDL